MESALMAGTLTAMTSPKPSRFDALDQRRQELGVPVSRLVKRAGYKSDQTWRDARKFGRPGTLEKLERALDWIEEHADDPYTPAAAPVSLPPDLIAIELEGNFGVRVVVRGPVDDIDALKEAAKEILRDMRGGQEPSHEAD